MSGTIAPGIWFEGPADYVEPTDPAQDPLTQLQYILQHGAFAATGATVIHIDSGEVSNGWVGKPYACYYQPILQSIAQYCSSHPNVKIAVEEDLNASQTGDNQWIGAATQARLPISYVEGDQEGPLQAIFTGTPTIDGNYTSVSSPDISNMNLTSLPTLTTQAVYNLVESFIPGLQQVIATWPGVQFGAWSGVFYGQQGTWNVLSQNFFQQFQAVVNGVEGAGAKPVYVLDEANWSAIPGDVSQIPALASYSAAIKNLALQVLQLEVPQSIQGTNAAFQQTNVVLESRIAAIATNPTITLSDLDVEMSDIAPSPGSTVNGANTAPPDAPIDDPTSESNLATEASAIYPLYQRGLITYNGSLGVSGKPQAVNSLNVGVSQPIALSTLSGGSGNVAVVVLDQSGLLNASQSGSATVTGSGTTKLILNGSFNDVAAALRTLSVSESSSNPDYINVEAFGSIGQLSDYVGFLQGSSAVTVTGATLATAQNTSANLTIVGGGNDVYLNGLNDTFTGTTTADTIVGGTGSITYVNGGAADSFTGGGGAVTINSGAGGGYYTTGQRASLVVSGSGASTISVAGNKTADTIMGGGNSIFSTNGSNTLFQAETLPGIPTVFGGSGSDTVSAGSEGGVYFLGSSSASFTAGTGAVTVTSGGILTDGSAMAQMTAGAANTTLVGGSGQTTMSGGGTLSPNTSYVLSTGKTTIFGGHGSEILFTGKAPLTAYLGTDTTSATLQQGRGTLFTGGGADQFFANNGSAGGNYFLDNFRPGVDALGLNNYSQSAISQAEANQVDSGGSSSFTLPDNTRITFVGLTSLPTGSIY